MSEAYCSALPPGCLLLLLTASMETSVSRVRARRVLAVILEGVGCQCWEGFSLAVRWVAYFRVLMDWFLLEAMAERQTSASEADRPIGS